MGHIKYWAMIWCALALACGGEDEGESFGTGGTEEPPPSETGGTWEPLPAFDPVAHCELVAGALAQVAYVCGDIASVEEGTAAAITVMGCATVRGVRSEWEADACLDQIPGMTCAQFAASEVPFSCSGLYR
jgi:hypothetical protein